MTTTLERIRLAVTAFDDPDRLLAMLGRLLGDGIAAQQICLIARKATLAAAATGAAGKEAVARLFGGTRAIDLPSREGTLRLVASEGPVIDLVLADRTRLGLGNGPDEPGPRVLDEPVSDADIMVIVMSSEARLQGIATRAMLAGSTRPVITHEYARSEPLRQAG